MSLNAFMGNICVVADNDEGDEGAAAAAGGEGGREVSLQQSSMFV